MHCVNSNDSSQWKSALTRFEEELKGRFLAEDNINLRPIMILHMLDLNHRITRLFSDEFIEELKIIIKDEIYKLIEIEEDDGNDNTIPMLSEFDQAFAASQNYSSDIDYGSLINEEVESFFRWKHTRLKKKFESKLNWFKDGISNTFSYIFKLVVHCTMFLGTTIAIENAFSISRRILRWDRLRLSREKIEELMLITMNPDIAIQYLAPEIANEFISNYNKKKYGAEDVILSIADQFDQDEVLSRFFIPIPK